MFLGFRATLALLLVSSSMAFARPEHNAFLNQSVTTTSELVSEFQRDAEVRKRYERQFHASDSEIIQFFQGLHVEPIRETQRYLVFNVDNGYVIRSRHLLLTKGVLVFADASHLPVLKASCGNPLVATLSPQGESDSQLHSAPGDTLSALTRNEPEAGGIAGAPTDQPAGVAPTLSPGPVAEVGPVVDIGPELPGAPMTSFAPIPGPGPASSIGESPGGVVAFAPLFGILGMTSLDHGSHHGAPAVTPEPATSLPLGLGLAGLWLRRRRRT
jgi:hypothetical protein